VLYSKKKEEGRLYSGKIWHGQTLQWKRKWNDPGDAMEKDGTTRCCSKKKMERPGAAVEKKMGRPGASEEKQMERPGASEEKKME
jgi:hypothetical protein